MVVRLHLGPDDVGDDLSTLQAVGVDDDPPTHPLDVPQPDLIGRNASLGDLDLTPNPGNQPLLSFPLPDVGFSRDGLVAADNQPEGLRLVLRR